MARAGCLAGLVMAAACAAASLQAESIGSAATSVGSNASGNFMWALPSQAGDVSAWPDLLGPDLLGPHLVEPVLFGKRKRRKAAICDDLDIQGEAVGVVPGKLNGCGATDAVRVRAVSGVTLSQQSVMTCETAQALKHWVEKGVQPAFRKDVVGLRVAAHYSCRTRNNRPGAKISEHGRGKAIDISGFILKNGDVITVLEGWKSRKTHKQLEKAWKAACGPFGTVLGPRSDRYHQDHFHLDTARHRGGPYCR
ncbi:extensin family protein [Epibacterium ulvae]|uniref:extensin-like domain-containing protein n=1 Tax=Epibacterium ulvae TaxID=1156985 RepID=UPI001BFC5248|nr:extensin family protein [Epibacterium ulvae]MBT8154284.1 extensin family protein [Epibacterium ulvae]